MPMQPSDKIKVFVSSDCQKPQYLAVRKQIRASLEESGFAKVYLFEDENASTLSAGQHYIYALQDSDVCIFLIDNADGIPPGVKKEIDIATRDNIKSLYYFCNATSENETPLQQSIKGYYFAKHRVVSSFDEFALLSSHGLLDDIVNIYRGYCKGRLRDADFEVSDKSIQKSVFLASSYSKQEIIKAKDQCTAFFQNFVLSERMDIENSDSLDEYCTKFLEVLFGERIISDFNLNLLLDALGEKQEEKYHAVIHLRWEGIQAYYLDNLEKCAEKMNSALSLARQYELPTWLIKDILIDIRNVIIEQSNMQNTMYAKPEAQEQLEADADVLFYPLLDRFEKEFNARLVSDIIKDRITSPAAVIMGNDVFLFSRLLTSIFVTAMFNGSLTHLTQMYNRVESLAFYLANKYSDWRLKVLYVQMLMMGGLSSTIKKAIDAFSPIISRMNSDDADRIYKFVSHQPIKYDRQISQLEVLKHLWPFFSDGSFAKVSADAANIATDWMHADEPNYFVQQNLFAAMTKIVPRINKDIPTSLCTHVLDNGWVHCHDDAFKLMNGLLGWVDAGDEHYLKLLQSIITLLKKDELTSIHHPFDITLIALRRISKDLSAELDALIREQLPAFYSNEYLLEATSDPVKDYPVFIQDQIATINQRNATQGQNGRYAGYGNNPYTIIGELLATDEVLLGEVPIASIVSACKDTLLAPKQTMGAKMHAAVLLMQLTGRNSSMLESCAVQLNEIVQNKSAALSGYDLHENLSQLVLDFCIELLFLCLGKASGSDMLHVVAAIQNQDIMDRRYVIRAIRKMTKYRALASIPSDARLVLMQYTLACCKSEDDFDMRYSAIATLLNVLSIDNQHIIIPQLIESMVSDNGYVKTLILNNIESVKVLDKTRYEYILELAQRDNNSFVRQKCLEILQNC